jgi:hypothetical protein
MSLFFSSVLVVGLQTSKTSFSLETCSCTICFFQVSHLVGRKSWEGAPQRYNPSFGESVCWFGKICTTSSDVEQIRYASRYTRSRKQRLSAPLVKCLKRASMWLYIYSALKNPWCRY